MFMKARLKQVNYISFVMHADLCQTENCGRKAAAVGHGIGGSEKISRARQTPARCNPVAAIVSSNAPECIYIIELT